MNENSSAQRPARGITNGDFAALAARLAQAAAAWAADTMMLPEDLGKPMDAETVKRFAHEMRTRIDRIMEIANGT